MNQLVNLSFQNNNIRIETTKDGEILFCAKDVCDVLGYGNPSSAIANHVDKNYDLHSLEVIDSIGRVQKTNFVNESGLYALIFNSRLEKAKEFKHWVTSEVLPSIRKTGKYESKEQQSSSLSRETLDMYSLVLEKAGITGNQLALSLDKAVRAKTGESALALTGTVLVAETQGQLYTPTQLGKELGISAQKVNFVLGSLELQKRVDSQWELTQAGKEKGGIYLDTNKRHSNGTPVRQLKWPLDVLKDIKDFIEELDR